MPIFLPANVPDISSVHIKLRTSARKSYVTSAVDCHLQGVWFWTNKSSQS